MPTSPAFAHPLVSAAQLQQLLAGDAPPLVLDCSFELADPSAGERAFEQGHIPGARYAHLDRDLAGRKNGRNGRHPLPAPEQFAATLASWQIGRGSRAVTYDRQNAPYAARAWWMLRWAGLTEVAVLDGGWQAWVAAGGAQASGKAVSAPRLEGALPAGPAAPGMPTIDAAQLLQRLGRVPLIDARAGERFRGEKEPLDPVAGHIPGALNHPFTQNLGTDGRFRPAAELRAHFEALLGPVALDEVVHQCGSGVTACHNLLAMEAAGLHGSRLYPGSWSEWCADPARPVARS